MKRVIVLRQARHESVGSFPAVMRARGLAIEYVDCFDPRWPHSERAGFEPRNFAGLIVMGGPMNVDQMDEYPFLATEVEWLERAVAAQLPTLGICLGAQLLASALGAVVARNRVKEVGWYQIEVLPPAAVDPLFAGSRPIETVFQWHGDAFALPQDAVQLARGATCEQQAFRYGPAAYGLQFHPEMTADMVTGWLDEPDLCADLAGLDYIDADEIRRRAPEALATMAPLAERLFGGFAKLCVERAP